MRDAQVARGLGGVYRRKCVKYCDRDCGTCCSVICNSNTSPPPPAGGAQSAPAVADVEGDAAAIDAIVGAIVDAILDAIVAQ